MSKSVIKDIFYGNRGNLETIKMTKEVENLYGVFSDAYDEFVKELTPQQLAILETCMEARENVLSEEIDVFYIEGFKLGLRIGIECMEDASM